MADREYRPRLVDRYLSEVLSDFAAVMVTGARAVGKTTTASQLAVNTVRLDRPGVAAAYRADPDAALRRAARPVLIDEWQEVPAVLGAVKRAVDRDPRPGQYLLTGSVRAQLQNETWAGTGRVVRMNMYGLTEREVTGRLAAEPSLFLTRLARSGIDGLVLPPQLPDIDDYVQLALRGGFPEVAYRDRSERSRGIWMASYLDDLVTRDAALAGQAKDPAKLRRYLNVLALHNAGIPADNTLYAAAAINAKTAAGYDQLLTNLFMLDAVPAWGTNRLKRLVKAPKRYLVDTGSGADGGGRPDRPGPAGASLRRLRHRSAPTRDRPHAPATGGAPPPARGRPPGSRPSRGSGGHPGHRTGVQGSGHRGHPRCQALVLAARRAACGLRGRCRPARRTGDVSAGGPRLGGPAGCALGLMSAHHFQSNRRRPSARRASGGLTGPR